MGFFVGWLIAVLDDHGPRSDEEAAAFAWMIVLTLGVGGYLLSIAVRLNCGIAIRFVSEGWYLLCALVASVIFWLSAFAFSKSL